jgi:3',5'-cyclic AMP phosphodiesterase CpdA
MLSLLHISDLHFGPPYLDEVGEALLRIAPQLSVDMIIASGDFTQRAKPEQFQQAREFLSRLPVLPLVKVPGNHDVPLYRIKERIFTPYELYQEHIHPELDWVLRHEKAVVVALNTTAPLRKITEGVIRPWQLDFCSEAFCDAPAEALKIIVAHHHFAPAPDYESDVVVHRWRDALDRFTALGVDMILGGHLHRAYVGNSLDLYPSNDRTSGIIIIQSGTTTSRRGRARERDKNSFNLIRVGDESVRVTHYMYFHEAGGFVPVSRHIFPRRSRHWFDDHTTLEHT